MASNTLPDAPRRSILRHRIDMVPGRIRDPWHEHRVRKVADARAIFPPTGMTGSTPGMSWEII
jgi:hypothetical protein